VPRQLWLLRHGEAQPHHAGPDADRRLTPEGEGQSRSAGAALARLNLELAACYASPRVRALETARLACAALGVDPVVHEPLSGGFESGGARELVLGEDDDARVLIVGHEPDLSGIVEALTGARIAMKKGGVAAVRLDGSREELLAVLRPCDLRAIEA